MEMSSIGTQPSILLGTPSESRDFLPLLRWLILMSLTCFGVAVLWQLGILQLMFTTDRTRISSLILALFVITTLHCLTQTWIVSKELTATRSFRDTLRGDWGRLSIVAADPNAVPQGSMIAQHVANLMAKARAQQGRRIDQTLLLRALADRLRSREKLGIFVAIHPVVAQLFL